MQKLLLVAGLLASCLSFSSFHIQADNLTAHGFADIHNHMMAEYAYGGAWFWGSHKGPEFWAMRSCQGNLGGTRHGSTILGPFSGLISDIRGSSGDTGFHPFRTRGYPTYEDWPKWDTIAHQQVYVGHLKRALDSGMTLLVMSAVDFKQLCHLMPRRLRKYKNCNTKESLIRQIEATHRLDELYDWFKVVTSPEQARRAVANGQLAVVLALEVSDLFHGPDWREELDLFYELGVRSVQPVHQLDNQFSGAAPHHIIFRMFQYFKNKGFKYDKEGKNVKGLTADGQDLIRELVRRNMLIDIAHMSERGVRGTWKLIRQEYEKYPLFVSHGHFRSMLLPKKQKEEKTVTDWQVEIVRDSGGVFGLRSGPEPTRSYGSVPNDCPGTSKSFAQLYEYGIQKLNVPITFASDMNGFIQQLRPRFGNKRETCGAEKNRKKRRAYQQAQKQPLGSRLDWAGLGRIDQLVEIIRELKNFGVDTTALENSTESFIRMWERTYERED